MKVPTNNIVRIPQLRKVRKVYEEDGKHYIRMDGNWWGMDEYKFYLKDKYSINISYEYTGE